MIKSQIPITECSVLTHSHDLVISLYINKNSCYTIYHFMQYISMNLFIQLIGHIIRETVICLVSEILDDSGLGDDIGSL